MTSQRQKETVKGEIWSQFVGHGLSDSFEVLTFALGRSPKKVTPGDEGKRDSPGVAFMIDDTGVTLGSAFAGTGGKS